MTVFMLIYLVANLEKSGKLVIENREKSGENVKKSEISEFAHNSLKLLLPNNC